MAIEQSALYDEVKAIMESARKPVFGTYEVTVHANGKDIDALYVDALEWEHNYLLRYEGVFSLEATFPLGTVLYKIVPYRSNLEVTVRFIEHSEQVKPTVEPAAPNWVMRYAATLYDSASGIIEGNHPAAHDVSKADRSEVKTLRFQLLDKNVQQLRTMTVGGIFRNVKAVDLMRLLLGKYSKRAKVDDAVAVKGVTIAPGHTEEIRNHIVVPHHTKLVDVPKAIEEVCGGVYPTGFQYYLRGNQWYIFAPYDITAYDKSPKTLTVINVPANRIKEPERSYRETPTQVLLLITGQVKNRDHSESAQLNQGNGVQFADARKMFSGFLSVENNKAVADRGANTSRLVVEPREDGLDHIVEAPVRITAAYLTEYGRIAARAGMIIEGEWENSNKDVLYPGMPLKFMYMQNGTVEELTGILIGDHTFEFRTTVGANNIRFISKTKLTMFVSRKVKLSNPV